jgi:hypothetical protein
MKKYIKFHPIARDLTFKISVLRTMMYGGVLWGLYNPSHKGWAIKSEQDVYIFPFWLSEVQANKYASQHWPSYAARKIKPKDFEESLLPTLTRLHVVPSLFNHKGRRFKLSSAQMHHFFFNHQVQSLSF